MEIDQVLRFLRRLRVVALASFLLLTGGCSTIGDGVSGGYLFTYVRIPYTKDLDNTSMADMHGEGKIVRIKEPFTGYGMYTELNTNAVGDIAEENGLTEVYFADLEILSVLGIWNHHRLYIYGRQEKESATADTLQPTENPLQ